MKTVQECNILIGKFMGGKETFIKSHTPNISFKNHPDSSRNSNNISPTDLHPKNLSYHKSFNWLIPVGNKILSNEFRKECKDKGFDPWMECDILDDICNNKWDIEKLHIFIVAFIEWYNSKISNQ